MANVLQLPAILHATVVTLACTLSTAALAASWVPLPAPLNGWANADGSSVLRTNGRVLMIGGGPDRTKVEEFDPTLQRWVAKAPLSQGSIYHSSAPMANGRVILVGGCSPIYCVNSNAVRIYNPTSNSWTTASNLLAPRVMPAVTLLPNGKILVSGGTAAAGTYTKVTPFAEIYNPPNNTWTAAGTVANTNLTLVSATLLADGRVLIVGGESTAKIYNPTTNTWANTQATTARVGHRAVRLLDGRVLLVGSVGTASATSTIYNPTTNGWSLVPNLLVPRAGGHTATLLDDGQVLVAGGAGTAATRSELYAPGNNSWTLGPNLVLSRNGHSAEPLFDDRVLVVGGVGASHQSAEAYDP